MTTSQISHFDLSSLSNEFKEILSSLPKQEEWPHFCQYQGFWYHPNQLKRLLACHQHFKARDGDLVLATAPKSGTTWLKALAFAIAHRSRYTFKQHPLLDKNPHELVPFLDDFGADNQKLIPDLNHLLLHTIFATHQPFSLLQQLVDGSDCRVVYLCRNPRDNIISYWQFVSKNSLEPPTLEETFDRFCKGDTACGPFLDHVLEYWKASLERPQKVLFLKYEEMKKEPIVYLKKLAEFLGYPFSLEEESEGVVEEISKLCSFENLSSLEVNKTGTVRGGVKCSSYFRRGEVGDWSNYLSPEMIERLDLIVEKKLGGSGLTIN